MARKKTRKDYMMELRSLPIANNYMFAQVMRDHEVCKLFLEELLHKEISRIEYLETEKNVGEEYIPRNVRLDVYLKDATGTVYNVEMQGSDDALERRSRYYQSKMDRETLDKENPFENLAESYVIFVCNFDYYGRGYALYERKGIIKECEDVEYDDGSHVYILNAKYAVKNAGTAILEYLDYVRTNDDKAAVTSELAKKTIAKTISIRNDEQKGVDYMTLQMEFERQRNEAVYIRLSKLAIKTMKQLNCDYDRASEFNEFSEREHREVRKHIPPEYLKN